MHFVNDIPIEISDPTATKSLDTKTVLIPLYLSIGSLKAELMEKACVASAALPFGVVPSVQIGSRRFVDGGVSDNVPVFPMMNHQEVDEIFVLLLEPIKSRAAAIRKYGINPEAWRKRDRDLRLARFEIPPSAPEFAKVPYSQKNKPPTIIPFRELSYCPEVIFVAPPSRLGRGLIPGFLREFVGGTLRFERGYASDLVLDGYLDTLKLLGDVQKKSTDTVLVHQSVKK